MQRRGFLTLLGGLGLSGCLSRPRLYNPCLPARLPPGLANHELLQQAFSGLRPEQIWDAHVHLLGVGDSDTGAWINPELQSLLHPWQYVRRQFYLNASCVAGDNVDQSYIERLLALKQGFPPASRFMLLAFDYNHDESGQRHPDESAFYTPNALAARLHREYPQDFEWIASVHPYRADAVQALEQARANGARAVKWLPSAMNINPGSARCDEFYAALARLRLPLLSHAGEEKAVQGSATQEYNNPLLLRRPLEHGVKVVIAHCASHGRGRDLDQGADGPWRPAFSLFARLMNEARHEGLLFGEISAITLRNRRRDVLQTLLETDVWHPRLVNGSDYPLPGILPLVSLQKLQAWSLLSEPAAQVLGEVRKHNAVLFDFMLKRLLRKDGKRFQPTVFESRRVYG